MTKGLHFWIALGALGVAFPAAAATDDGFQIVAHSSTGATFDALADLRTSQVAFVSRAQDWSHSEEPLRLKGWARGATLERYEERWTRLSQPRHFEPGSFGPFAAPQRSVREDLHFELTTMDPWASVIFVAEAGSVDGWTTASVQAPVRSPCLAIMLPSDQIGYNNPNERGSWCTPGNFLVVNPSAFKGTFRGNITFYWFDATVSLHSTSGSEELVSRARYETGRPTGAVDVLHAVWYFLKLHDAEIQISSVGHAPHVKTTFLANQISGTVKTASFAAPANVSGTLPNTTRQDAASMWVTGNMTVDLQALKETAASGRSTYRIRLVGPSDAIEAYAFGGGEIQYVRQNPSLIAPVTAAILVTLLAAWGLYAKLRRETLLEHGARGTIARLIREQPGISVTEIQLELDRTSKGDGFTRHHLKQLERFGLIVSCRVGRSRRQFWKDDWGRMDATKRGILASSPVDRIADSIVRQPGVTREAIHRELEKHLRLSRSTLSYHLGRLTKQGLVTRQRSGKHGRFYPTPDLIGLIRSRPGGNV